MAESSGVPVSQAVREALHAFLGCQKGDLERLAKEAEIDRCVRQLDFLDWAQRKMLRSGSFLGKSYPRDWTPVQRWAVGVSGEEREALELILAERESVAHMVAKLVKETYSGRGKWIVLTDRKPEEAMTLARAM